MRTRREWLGGLAATAATVGVAEPGHAAQPSLQALAASKGLTFGSAAGLGAWGGLGASLRDPDYRALLIADCGLIVPENELKWYSLRPDAETFDFSKSDQMAAFAADNGMALRGHTLLWHHPRWFPDWLTHHDFGSGPASEAERLLTDHVRRVCGRYPQVMSWDVVNETVDADTGALRETVLSRAMGQAVLDLAFHTAREAAPKAQLVYNDYMSWEAGHEVHRAGVLRLLEGLKARGAPIDALGVQSHIGSGNSDEFVGFDTARERDWRRFMDEVVGMGLDIVITEFDVHDKNLPRGVGRRDQAIAGLARRYLDLMLDYRQTKAVVAWGMVDKYSWLQGQWPRADDLAKRPTPYDADYRAKPLRTAIAQALATAPRRSPIPLRSGRLTDGVDVGNDSATT